MEDGFTYKLTLFHHSFSECLISQVLHIPGSQLGDQGQGLCA